MERNFKKNSRKSDKLKDNNFPFNFREFVPEVQIENMSGDPDYIRIISYNILSDSLLPISMNIPEKEIVNLPHLHWEKRKNKILSELAELSADIICLQEFERDESFIKTLGDSGYNVKIILFLVHFQAKNRRSFRRLRDFLEK